MYKKYALIAFTAFQYVNCCKSDINCGSFMSYFFGKSYFKMETRTKSKEKDYYYNEQMIRVFLQPFINDPAFNKVCGFKDDKEVDRLWEKDKTLDLLIREAHGKRPKLSYLFFLEANTFLGGPAVYCVSVHGIKIWLGYIILDDNKIVRQYYRNSIWLTIMDDMGMPVCSVS